MLVEILLIALIVIVSFAVAYLVYSILSARKSFATRLTNLEHDIAHEEYNPEELDDDEASEEDGSL